jgi:hypothetical protein
VRCPTKSLGSFVNLNEHGLRDGGVPKQRAMRLLVTRLNEGFSLQKEDFYRFLDHTLYTLEK